MAIRSFILAFLLLAGFATAGPSPAADDAAGRAMYLRYCGACHGPGGTGDGVAGTFMRPKPTDLTQITTRAGGEFPFQRIAAVIDGTTETKPHGEAGMPVWGEIFRAEAGWDATRRAEARSKVMMITEYVRSIQAK